MRRGGEPTGMDSAAMAELRLLARKRRRVAASTSSRWSFTATRRSRFLPQASERQASLIILGATQRSALENLTRDRTVYQVLAHARCPVLTIREPMRCRPKARWKMRRHSRVTAVRRSGVRRGTRFLARLGEIFKLVNLDFAFGEDGLYL